MLRGSGAVPDCFPHSSCYSVPSRCMFLQLPCCLQDPEPASEQAGRRLGLLQKASCLIANLQAWAMHPSRTGSCQFDSRRRNRSWSCTSFPASLLQHHILSSCFSKCTSAWLSESSSKLKAQQVQCQKLLQKQVAWLSGFALLYIRSALSVAVNLPSGLTVHR